LNRRDKRVKTKSGIPLLVKQPKAEEPVIQFYKLRPAWRIARMEMREPFGWHELGKEKLEYIRQKLRQFENSTWNEILLIGKKQSHSIAVSDLSKEAQQRLTELRIEDVDEVISLHLSGKERVFGVRQDIALALLWWDPEHEVCPSVLKHT
jgi:hypothetical protein